MATSALQELKSGLVALAPSTVQGLFELSRIIRELLSDERYHSLNIRHAGSTRRQRSGKRSSDEEYDFLAAPEHALCEPLPQRSFVVVMEMTGHAYFLS